MSYRRYRQKVEYAPAGVYWRDDPNFDLARQMKRAKLPDAAASRGRRVREIGRGRLEGLGALGGVQKNLALGGLVGCIGADRPEHRPFRDRRAKIVAMIGPPGQLQGRRRLFGVERP